MFVVDRNRELVGYSAWTWDSLYAPVVGCYHHGRLIAHAVCDQEWQDIGLDGPKQRWWFRMRVASDVRQALEDRDPAVRLLRMEDGEPVAFAGPPGRDASSRRAWRIEEFLSFTSRRDARLDGFTAFLSAPLLHQLDILFLDILNRLPDPEARAHYGERMESGESVFRLRGFLLDSEEFTNRRITVSDRVGSLITSSMWHDLAAAEALGTRRSPLRQLRMTDYAALSDEEFATRIHLDCHGDEPSDIARDNFAALAASEGRLLVASLLVRDAAHGGRFYDLVDSAEPEPAP